MTSDDKPDMTGALVQRYDTDAVAYDRYWAPVLHPIECELVDGLGDNDVRVVVDVGAGTGTLLPVLRQKFAHATVLGVDRSPGMIARADGAVAVMDAMALAIRDEAIDVAVMAFMLFHLPDLKRGLAEARRVIRPGGHIATATWASDFEAPAVDIWNEELEAQGAIPADALPVLARHERVDSPAKVQSFLGAAGFADTRASEHAFTHRLAVEEFICLRQRLGSMRQRYESLDEAAQDRCVARARERLSATPGDLTLSIRAVFAYGQCPVG